MKRPLQPNRQLPKRERDRKCHYSLKARHQYFAQFNTASVFWWINFNFPFLAYTNPYSCGNWFEIDMEMLICNTATMYFVLQKQDETIKMFIYWIQTIAGGRYWEMLSSAMRRSATCCLLAAKLEGLFKMSAGDSTLICVMKGAPLEAAKNTQLWYFLRFTRVITSFSCTRFLRKLAHTLHTCIYWVQANIMSIGRRLANWVHRCNCLS